MTKKKTKVRSHFRRINGKIVPVRKHKRKYKKNRGAVQVTTKADEFKTIGTDIKIPGTDIVPLTRLYVRPKGGISKKKSIFLKPEAEKNVFGRIDAPGVFLGKKPKFGVYTLGEDWYEKDKR